MKERTLKWKDMFCGRSCEVRLVGGEWASGSTSCMADEKKRNESSRYVSAAGRESVLALEVPFSIGHCQEDEMLSWLQYPLKDSVNKNYCSEEIHSEVINSQADIFHGAFSNLTLKDATQTWGLPEARKGERTLAANVAMAMAAQRAAGLFSQSGADAFNKVRTHSRPNIASASHDHSTEGTCASDAKLERSPLSSHRNAVFPNFSPFSRVRQVADMQSQATQKPKLGCIRHSGCLNGNQAVRMATQSKPFKKVEQLSAVSDRPVFIKERSSLCFPPNGIPKDTGTGFSGSASPRGVKLEITRKLMEEWMVDAKKSMQSPSVSSSPEGKSIDLLATHGIVTSSALSSPPTKQDRHYQFSPATFCVGGSMLDPRSKRIKAKLEAKHSSLQSPSSSGSASTVIIDTDSCRQSKRLHYTIETKYNTDDSNIFTHPTNLQKNVLCPVRTSSGSDILDSQVQESVCMAPVSRLWGDRNSYNIMEGAPMSPKRKALCLDSSNIQCKVFKDGNRFQGHALEWKGIQAGEMQLFKREHLCKSSLTGEKS